MKFWYHYNKPASRSTGQPTMTVHYRGVCHFVQHIDCKPPTKTRHRNSQPNIVITGNARDIQFVDGTAYIN